MRGRESSEERLEERQRRSARMHRVSENEGVDKT